MAGSCWYYLRYIDPKNENMLADPEKLKHWLPVDLYIGGVTCGSSLIICKILA